MKKITNIFARANINSFTKRYFSTEVQPWIETQNRIVKSRNELVLSDHSKIEEFTLNLIRNYYRTTNKDSVSKNSLLSEHGLDSLDSLELCVQLEDELGYIIEAETMNRFSKVSHFINYIKHIEAYKKEHKMLPQEAAVNYDINFTDYVPIVGEKLNKALKKYTKVRLNTMDPATKI